MSENNLDLISVIMPAYNAERYIEEAIDSVVHQLYPNWELVIADDSSTDGTARIINHYSKTTSQIKTFRTDQNSGCSAALNLALSHTKGNYICWLSADDKYDKCMLADSISFLKNNPQYGGCYSRHSFIDQNSDLLYSWTPQNSENEPYLSMIQSQNPFCACTLLGKKEFFNQVGEFDTIHKFANDYDYMMRLAACTDIGYLDKQTMYSRIHPHQVSNEGHNQIDRMKVYEKMLYNDFVRSSLFKKAKVTETRRFVTDVLDIQIELYASVGQTENLNEAVRIKKDFLTKFPLIKEADRHCHTIIDFLSNGEYTDALKYIKTHNLSYADDSLIKKIALFLNTTRS